MTRIAIDLGRPEPAWQQLVDGVLDLLLAGSLAVGGKLPSVRRMAQEVRLNPNTVARAYRELEVLGAVEGRQGRGVFVTPDGPAIARKARGGALEAEIRRAIERAREAGLDDARIQKVVDAALRAGRSRRGSGKEKA